jgi:TPR repeat protein
VAEQGDAFGQILLATMHRVGRGGVPKDDHKAVEWYQKAAEQGHAGAQYILGHMYADDADGGVAKDERKAFAWYQKSAEQGNPAAQGRLGDMYRDGRGVAKDERKAAEWHQKAAEQRERRRQKSSGP